MTLSLKTIIAACSFLLASVLLAVFIHFTAPHAAFGAVPSTQVPGVTLHFISQPKETQDFYTFFVATTTTATSTNAASAQDPGYFRIAGATDVIFYFSRGDTKGTGNSGSSVFKVQVSPDGTNWFDYNELGQVINTTTADAYFTRAISASIPSGTSTVQWAMDDLDYYAVRCITVRTTDGEASCKATATF